MLPVYDLVITASLICKFIRTPWFRYLTQPDMYG